MTCVPALYGYLRAKADAAKSEENLVSWISKTL